MMERPRIKRSTQRVQAPNGDLYFMRPSAGRDTHIENPSESDRHLLAALDGSQDLTALIERFGKQEVLDCVASLQEVGLIEDAADDDRIDAGTWERFDRQLRYFSDVSDGPPASECQERLGSARVAVLGVGGLGGWSALALACHGIGEMVLVDFDRVELSNLNRQVLYTEADVGRPKVAAAAERLEAFDSRLKIEARDERLDSEEAVARVIAKSDVVIDAVDWPALDIERWVNAACFGAGIPYIAMSHFPPVARIGPFYVPGLTGCYACQEIAYRREYPMYDLVMEQQRSKGSPAATLGSACALIGGLVALDLLHHLTGIARPSTFGASHILDLRTGALEREQVVAEPNCPVCGETQPETCLAS
jgi:bacteriocin biosynthesis cyclodehydratase domain-containing protein